MAKRPSLGRGLATLLPESRDLSPVGTREIPLAQITPNPYQPRLHFDETQLAELASSIGRHGVLQPILVTATREGYQLVAGERRVQAALRAGLELIPAQVKDLDERTILAIALVENVQRAELDPIEKAKGLARLKAEFGATQAELAEEIGVSRPQVGNLLRLLDLPEAVQHQVQAGTLSLGHAKVLLSLDGSDLTRFADTCVKYGWSVRELEFAIQKGWIDGPPPETLANLPASGGREEFTPRVTPALDPDLVRLEQQLAEHLGTPCKIKMQGKETGGISLQFYSLADADRLIRRLLQS